MKQLMLVGALLFGGLSAWAQDALTQEIVTGTLHVIWIIQDPATVIPNDTVRGYWVSLHSDDDNTVSFSVTLRYRLVANGAWQSARRTVDNTTTASGGTYWVSTPAQCLFTVTQWPVEVQYYVSENKVPVLRELLVSGEFR